MARFWRALSLALILCPVSLLAQVSSGPAVGTAIMPLKVEGVVGDYAGTEVDVAGDRANKPTVYLFVHAHWFDRPIGRFMKKLDDAVRMYDGKVTVVAVWLTDDRENTAVRLMAIHNSLQFAATSLCLYPSLTDLPHGWDLDTQRTHLTAVVAAEGKVKAKFAYVSLNETNVPEVLRAIDEALK